MAQRFPHLPLLVFFCLCSSAIIAHQDEDPTTKTMEDFSGYPIHEPHYFIQNFVSSLSVDTQSLQKQIDELATFSDTPAPSVTRILYTEKDVLARRYIKNLMGLSGLSVREDAVGNIFGRWDGYEPKLPAVATGSHIDAIPYSGKNDAGLAGAELALAVEKHVLESGSIDTVGTVDTRDIDEQRRNIVIEKIYQSAIKIAKDRGSGYPNLKL
ncbi:ureidoglycolate hydrolase isoform X2 [Fagus crenata]